MAQNKRERLEEVVQETEKILDESLDEPLFFCDRRERELSKDGCYEAFTSVHAYEAKASQCWNCRQGSRNRLSYIWEDEDDIPSDMVNYMLPGGEKTMPMSVVMAFFSGDEETIRAWKALRRLRRRRR